MNQHEKKLCDEAVSICRSELGHRLRIMFALGAKVLAMVTIQRQRRKPDDSPDDKTRAEALKMLREYCLSKAAVYGYKVPTSDVYWFAAIYANTFWTEAQREILIKSNQAWTNIPIVLAEPDHGVAMIAKIAKGELVKVPRNHARTLTAQVRRAQINRAQDNLHLDRDYDVICHVRKQGQVQEEDIEAFLAHLISVVGIDKMDKLWGAARHRNQQTRREAQ